MITSETKTFAQIFFESFLIVYKYFASTIQDLFSFLQKGFLTSQSVRLSVKSSARELVEMKTFKTMQEH
jgi:hypothetical protein